MTTTVDYSVRLSPRAKHVRLKLSARDGLVVVVPMGFDQARIPGILEKKRQWLAQTQQRLEERRKFFVPMPPGELPERVTLHVIGEVWTIDYRPTDAAIVAAVERPGKRLLVYGNIENDKAATDALRRWISRKTHEHLVPWLSRLAAEQAFDVSGIVVKSQRTRWASCSAKRTISLNLRLMFLPGYLVRYVLLHELAHTREMNHSKRFWATLRLLERDHARHDTELRSAWQLIPAWVSTGPSPEI